MVTVADPGNLDHECGHETGEDWRDSVCTGMTRFIVCCCHHSYSQKCPCGCTCPGCDGERHELKDG